MACLTKPGGMTWSLTTAGQWVTKPMARNRGALGCKRASPTSAGQCAVRAGESSPHVTGRGAPGCPRPSLLIRKTRTTGPSPTPVVGQTHAWPG